MNTRFKLLATLLILILGSAAKAQGIVTSVITNGSAETFPSCASYDFLERTGPETHDYLELSNDLMYRLQKVLAHQGIAKDAGDIYRIPVVFHVVYNNAAENLPDSVIQNQLEILNSCFRRTNADTSNLRPAFQALVGDTRIEFKLAETDPDGNPTNGITRTPTTITHFGGILPYAPGQSQEISDWVNDSLYYNLFRLTQDSLGGSSAWDTDHYLNIWIGDMRISEPQFNFEELVFFGLSTPPADQSTWPDSVLQMLSEYSQGVLMHYVTIGSNNPNLLPSPYNGYNGVITNGKYLNHEVGHYLGLRHIWGDGDCSFDDFVGDTPNSNASSAFGCSQTANHCVDNINGTDLPDMIENYMDYANGNCQNSFTKGQIAVMHAVLENFRPELAETIVAGVQEVQTADRFVLYPNPSNGHFTVDLGSTCDFVRVTIRDLSGKEVFSRDFTNTSLIELSFDGTSGMYLIEFTNGSNILGRKRLLKN